MPMLATIKPGYPKQVADVVKPAAGKGMARAERFASPDVEAALLRKPAGKIGGSERDRNLEQNRCSRPQEQGSGPGMSSSRNPAHAQNSRNIEEHQVPQTQLPLQAD